MEEHIFDLLPGYALGCLDEADLLIVARHLPQCAACRAELATYLAAADQVAMAASLRTPPVDLREKILRRAAGRAAAVPTAAAATNTAAAVETGTAAPSPASAPASPRTAVPPIRRPGLFDSIRVLFSQPAGLALGALALLLIVLMAASNFILWQRVNELQAQAPPSSVQLVRLAGTGEAPQARGLVMVFQNETYGTLVVENAPPTPPGSQYQLWLISDGKRTDGGVFTVGKSGYGVLEVWADQPLDTFPAFGITLEPEGGSPAPTGKKILGTDL